VPGTGSWSITAIRPEVATSPSSWAGPSMRSSACARPIEAGSAAESPACLGDGDHVGYRELGARHDRVEKNLVRGRLVSMPVVASDMHPVLGLFADEAALLLQVEIGVLEPIIEVFARG
jgi:hypothetical protein